MPAHDGKRQVMAPRGRFMAENDKSWTPLYFFADLDTTYFFSLWRWGRP